MRLIDADAFEVNLINAIMLMKNMAKAIGLEDDPAIQAEIKAYQDILNGVKEQPTIEPEPKWIPCSERLPDVAQRVLLSGHGQVMVGMLHSFGKYSLEPTGISYVYPKDDIEAWMPLPEPYKEGAQS